MAEEPIEFPSFSCKDRVIEKRKRDRTDDIFSCFINYMSKYGLDN